MYTAEIASLAKRENNTKRNYLVINKYQGKHIPVSPGKALDMFSALAELVRRRYPNERLLVVGFAETATAIGETLAAELDTYGIHTTREKVPHGEYLYFSESHSHATEQKLVKNELDKILEHTDRVIFAEDEVTTGNTIRKIIRLLRETYGEHLRFSAASLLNGMDENSRSVYQAEGIDLVYLVKADYSGYPERAESCRGDGTYYDCRSKTEAAGFDSVDSVCMNSGSQGLSEESHAGNLCHITEISGYMNTRKLHHGKTYRAACEEMCEQIFREIPTGAEEHILVLGTEEFMYPGLYLGRKLQEQGRQVRFHATTRSPIAVSSAPEYPLHERYQLVSFYDSERVTYIYDLSPCHRVLVLTDAAVTEEGLRSLLQALHLAGNDNIQVIRWC